MPATPRWQAASSTGTSRRPSFWSPAQPRTCVPLQHQTWETFSVNWQTDVRIAFHWLREALLKPLRPGSRVVVISSGAALTRVTAQRRVRRRQGHPALHHRLRPGRGEARRPGDHLHRGAAPDHAADRVGRPAVQAYAARAGQSEEDTSSSMGPLLTPEIAGAAVVELVQADAAAVAPAYLLTGAGLQTLPEPTLTSQDEGEEQ